MDGRVAVEVEAAAAALAFSLSLASSAGFLSDPIGGTSSNGGGDA